MRDVQFFHQGFDLILALGFVPLDQFDHSHDVFFDIHAAKNTRLLRQIADAETGALIHWQCRDIRTIDPDHTVIGADQTHNHVKTSGVPRAVGPQQPDDFAPL